MTLKFIPTTEADRKFFIHVHHTAYRDTIEKMFGWDEALQDGFANKAFDEGGMNIIYHEDERIGVVGWEDFPDYLWLKEVFLLPEFQGQGIGKQIVTLSQERAKKAGKKLRLQTLKANLGAKRLYERCGFNVTEATDTHWKMLWEPELELGRE